jgi:hypothetical protein
MRASPASLRARHTAEGDRDAGYSLPPMRHRLPLPAGPALGLALVGAVAAGCGGSSSVGNGLASKSPAAIVAAAKAAADGAASVHVSGAVNEGVPLSLDMYLLAGKGGRGYVTQNGLRFELIALGSTVYIKGSPAFYRHIGGDAAARLLQGKWLKVPAAAGQFAPITGLTDLRKLIDTALASHGTLVKGPTTSVGGLKVVAVNDTSKGGVLYVAATGKPFPAAVARSGANGGRIVFDRWNGAVTISPPLNAINLTQLQAGR